MKNQSVTKMSERNSENEKLLFTSLFSLRPENKSIVTFSIAIENLIIIRTTSS